MFKEKKYIAELIIISLIMGAAVFSYCVSVENIILNANTWVDEIIYLIKSWQYASGQVLPYTNGDSNWYMPLYFYQLGAWQLIFGQSVETSRLLSSFFGLFSSLIVFDLVRKITGNNIAAALSVLIFLTTPSVVFYFGTATPISTVSFLLLFTIWVSIEGIGRVNSFRSFLIGMLFSILFLYRQNMVLALLLITPIYLSTIPRQKILHFIIILTGILSIFILAFSLFPKEMFFSALRLPIITPILSDLGLLNQSLYWAEKNTFGEMGLSASFNRISVNDIFDAFLLPYAGIIFGTILVFALARKRTLRVLYIGPVSFLFLATTHYIGSLGYCQTCILPYTASFAGIGAICCGLAIALIYSINKNDFVFRNLITLSFSLTIILLNLSASGLATRNEYRFYPSAMLVNTRPISWQKEVEELASFISQTTDEKTKILPIHNLSSLPYAVFLAERKFPSLSINMRHSYRKINFNQEVETNDTFLDKIENSGLWTDSNMERWISNTYDTIIYQSDPRKRDSKLLERIEKDFYRSASKGYRGWNIHIYKRASFLPVEKNQ